jgi:hypothetical protein
MEVSQDSLMLLKSAIESAHTKITESFQHIYFTDIKGLDLLRDAIHYLIAIEYQLEQGERYDLDSALSCLTQDYLDYKLHSNSEVSDG